jgi:c-di-GMP-binding flagellar brake protein YcgR
MFLGKKKDADTWKEKGGGSELRTHPRMPIKTLVALRTRGRKEANCKLTDISLGGLGLTAPWPLTIGDAVSLTLPPPHVPKAPKDPVFIDARVCRVIPSKKSPGEYLTGLHFEEMSEEAERVVRLWFDFFGEPPEKRPRR